LVLHPLGCLSCDRVEFLLYGALVSAIDRSPFRTDRRKRRCHGRADFGDFRRSESGLLDQRYRAVWAIQRQSG
jgi:hypothetical protein